MERRKLSKPQVGGLSRAQHTALQARKKRIAEITQKRNAERNAELLAKARIEYKAEPIKPGSYPKKPSINAQFFRPGPASKQSKVGFKITATNRKVRALQVWTDRDPTWGNVKVVVVNDYTSSAEIDKIDRELRLHLMGWSNNGYFGPGAKFRIETVKAPG